MRTMRKKEETKEKAAGGSKSKAVPAAAPSGPRQYVWKRLQGKFHYRDGGSLKTVNPGDTFLATKDRFAGSKRWELMGPADGKATQAPPPKVVTTFRKEEVDGKEGQFNVFRKTGDEEEVQVNDDPLTEEEADDLINAALEG
jgi:hypothetical protein